MNDRHERLYREQSDAWMAAAEAHRKVIERQEAEIVNLSEKLVLAKAAIKSVQELCESRYAEVADIDPFYRQVVLVSVDEVRSALEGEQ